MIIYPIDNKEYGLNTDWYFSKKEDGISFFINPWDYFSTVGNCLDSINMLQKYGINYEIIIGMTNYASDRVLSETEHRVFSSKQHYPIKIVQYPFYTSRPGMEMLCTPIGSIHSTIWLLNYLLFQTNYSTVFRFDADLLLNIQFIEELIDNYKQGGLGKVDLRFYDTGLCATEWRIRNTSNFIIVTREGFWGLFNSLLPSKEYHYKNSILHIQSNTPVTYKTYNPWWEYPNNSICSDATKELFNSYMTKFGYSTNESMIARNSNPQTNELVFKVKEELKNCSTIDVRLEKAIWEEIHKHEV